MTSMKKILIVSSWSGDCYDRFLPIISEIRIRCPGNEIHALFHKLLISNSNDKQVDCGIGPFDKIFLSKGVDDLRCKLELCNEYESVYVFIRHDWIFGDDELFKEIDNKKINAKYILRNLLSLQRFFLSGEDQKKEIVRILSKNKKRDFEIHVKAFFLACITRIALFLLNFFDRFRVKERKYKILFIRLDVLGDMVLSLPALLALRKTYPDAELTVLASKRSGILIEEQHRLYPNRFCDHLVLWQASWHENKERLQKIESFFRLFFEAMQFYRKNYNLIVQPVELGTGVVFAALMRGGRTVASVAERLPLASLVRDLVESVNIAPYELYHIADLPDRCAQAAGAMNIDMYRHNSLVVSREYEDEFFRVLNRNAYNSSQKIVVINIGAGSPKRRWNTENYALLLQRLLQDKIYFPIVVGGEGDLELWGHIASRVEGELVDFVGKTNLNQVIALLSLADLVVTPDTGVMHLAAALDKKIVALFGAGWVPFCKPLCTQYKIVKQELGCSGCGDICFQEGVPPCISRVTVEMVSNAINELSKED